MSRTVRALTAVAVLLLNSGCGGTQAEAEQSADSSTEPSTKPDASDDRVRSSSAVAPDSPPGCGITSQPRTDRVLAFRLDVSCPVSPDWVVVGGIRAVELAVTPTAPLLERLELSAAESWDRRVNEVGIRGGRAIIDLDLTGEGSTSNQTQSAIEILSAVAFQFSEITQMEPRYNGSCDAFASWAEGSGCMIEHRSDR